MQDESARRVVETQHAVVIAGAGPTGLMLAGELGLAGVDVAIIERRETQELDGSRARGLLPRTIELLDQRGIAERFVALGQKYHVAPFAQNILDISDLPSRHNYYLGLGQDRVEQLLVAWVAELSLPIYRGREVTGFAQDDSGVHVQVSDGSALRAKYFVGCDGGRSFVRKHAEIEFPGWEASQSYLIAEAATREEPAWGIHRSERGNHALAKLDDGKRVGVVVIEPELRLGEQPTLSDVSAALIAVCGTDYGIHDATRVSRFTDMTRQAATYRKGRVLLAGDAAHVHSPMGGQGLSIGIQDAVNLGWKLAQVVSGTSPDSLLDSYHAERHPAGARALRTSMALTALDRGDARNEALRELVSEMTRMNEPRRRYTAMISGLDIHYDLGQGHPLLGRRMPDLDLHIESGSTESGARRLFTLLHAARPVLLELGAARALDIAAWAPRIAHVSARYTGAWELPVLGAVPAPAAVLIRPDGHVAWVGQGTDEGLRDALIRWFGPPAR